MSAFTPASEVLLRHSDDFEQSRILFAGDLQDDLPARLDTAASPCSYPAIPPLAGIKPPDGG
ncbi:ribosomal RNA small subunit methyltransferase C [Escherichia coli]|nr:ribosomal RNA small subunit methyltransferase C [Escherichia coli]